MDLALNNLQRMIVYKTQPTRDLKYTIPLERDNITNFSVICDLYFEFSQLDTITYSIQVNVECKSTWDISRPFCIGILCYTDN